MKIIRHPRHTVLIATLLVVVATILAFVIAGLVAAREPKLKEILQQAGVTLVFGALLGGVAKMLLEDFDRGREQRAERAQFVTNVLGDLKAVYDRVERARILLPAHRSALTYGNEMRDLISARVQLNNVIRALDTYDVGISSPERSSIRQHIEDMEKYLNSLTGEFQQNYKPLADLQRAYEARVDAALKKGGVEGTQVGVDVFRNKAWEQLAQLPQLDNFLTGKHHEHCPDYQSHFVRVLDIATGLLRAELRKIFTANAAIPPLADNTQQVQVPSQINQDH
jgi:hypothetical protein